MTRCGHCSSPPNGSFEYVAPTSVDEAVQALAAGGGDAKVMAGGQSLLPMMKLRLASPSLIVDINNIAGLDTLEESDGMLDRKCVV